MYVYLHFIFSRWDKTFQRIIENFKKNTLTNKNLAFNNAKFWQLKAAGIKKLAEGYIIAHTLILNFIYTCIYLYFPSIFNKSLHKILLG